MPTGLIRHTQKDPAKSNKKLFTALYNFIYPDATLFRQIEEIFHAIRIKLMGKWRECIITCSKKMQMQFFHLFYTTFRKLCLSDMISKTKATDVRALRAPEVLNGLDQDGVHSHTPASP